MQRKTILYSMASLGNGHACRSIPIIEALKQTYRVVVFTTGDSYKYLKNVFLKDEIVSVIDTITPLTFDHDENGEMKIFSTTWKFVKYISSIRQIKSIMNIIFENNTVEFCISDCEPILPRLCKNNGIKCIAIGSHVKFLTCVFPRMPFLWLCYSLIVRVFCQLVIGNCTRFIDTNSFKFDVRQNFKKKYKYIGPILRKDILEKKPTCDGYYLVYLREKIIPSNILTALYRLKKPVKVYGMEVRDKISNLEFCEGGESFTNDLVHCDGVIAKAGNQLIGEAIYLGKAIFVYPEHRQFEQYLNAYFLKYFGKGKYQWKDNITSLEVCQFFSTFSNDDWSVNTETMQSQSERIMQVFNEA